MYPPYIKGGGEISTNLLAENLAKLGIDVTVLTFDYRPRVEVKNNVKVKRITTPNIYWSYESSNKPKLIKLFWHLQEAFNPLPSKKITSYLKNLDFDLVHTNVIEDFSTNTWRFLSSFEKPIIHTLRSYYLMCYRGNMFKNGVSCATKCYECKAMTQLKKWNSQYVNCVVGISKDILNRHLNDGYFKNAKPLIIHNSYEAPPIKEVTKPGSQFLRLGFIGKLDKHKGILFLVERIKNLQDVILYIAGFGPLEKDVINAASKHKNIIFCGRTAPEKFYQQIDVLVVPSLWNEPFGRIVIESFAFGIPVISTNKGGLPELVKDSETGFIFNPENGAELETKINLLKDRKLLDRLGQNCKKESLRFTNINIAKQYKELYKKIVG